jgi:hypothetical protein
MGVSNMGETARDLLICVPQTFMSGVTLQNGSPTSERRQLELGSFSFFHPFHGLFPSRCVGRWRPTGESQSTNMSLLDRPLRCVCLIRLQVFQAM